MSEQGKRGAVLAVLDTPDDAARAVAAIERAGVSREAITIMSSEPIRIAASRTKPAAKSVIGLFAVAGGLLGAIAALLLTTWTSRRVNLITGGMPVVSFWAFGVVVFEMTALGAIFAGIGRTFREARLLSSYDLSSYDEAVADGHVVLSIAVANDAQRELVGGLLESQFGAG